jgi:hypothetical protein
MEAEVEESYCCRVTTPFHLMLKLKNFSICAKHRKEGWKKYPCHACHGTGITQEDRAFYSKLRHESYVTATKGEPCGLCWGSGEDVDTIDTHLCGCRVRSSGQQTVKLCPTHKVGPLACCPKAKVNPCVCAYSYKCPVHGVKHVGTHD